MLIPTLHLRQRRRPFFVLISVISFFLLSWTATASSSSSSSSSSSTSPSLFCKCICGSNYTIISLSDPPPKSPNSLSLDLRSLPHSLSPNFAHEEISNPPEAPKPTDPAPPPPKTGTCSDCTRHLCYSYHLPICVDQKIKEEDIVTMCFQRDSQKDRLVVYLFIFTTVGLLIYAVLKPWVEKWLDMWKQRRALRYTTLPGEI